MEVVLLNSISRSEAPDWPAPMRTVTLTQNRLAGAWRGRQRTGPEHPGRQIALGHGNLPVPRILPQDLANRLRRHTEASIFSRHEELAHVVLNAAPVVGLRVDQGEANQPFLHTDQQRMERANNC